MLLNIWVFILQSSPSIRWATITNGLCFDTFNFTISILQIELEVTVKETKKSVGNREEFEMTDWNTEPIVNSNRGITKKDRFESKITGLEIAGNSYIWGPNVFAMYFVACRIFNDQTSWAKTPVEDRCKVNVKNIVQLRLWCRSKVITATFPLRKTTEMWHWLRKRKLRKGFRRLLSRSEFCTENTCFDADNKSAPQNVARISNSFRVQKCLFNILFTPLYCSFLTFLAPF